MNLIKVVMNYQIQTKFECVLFLLKYYNNNFFLNNIIYIGNFNNLIKNRRSRVYFSTENDFDEIWENDEIIDETKVQNFIEIII